MSLTCDRLGHLGDACGLLKGRLFPTWGSTWDISYGLGFPWRGAGKLIDVPNEVVPLEYTAVIQRNQHSVLRAGRVKLLFKEICPPRF